MILSIGPSAAPSSFELSEMSKSALAPALSPDKFIRDKTASLAMTYLEEST